MGDNSLKEIEQSILTDNFAGGELVCWMMRKHLISTKNLLKSLKISEISWNQWNLLKSVKSVKILKSIHLLGDKFPPKISWKLLKSLEFSEIHTNQWNHFKSVKSFKISQIRVKSRDFEIHTPFLGVGDPYYNYSSIPHHNSITISPLDMANYSYFSVPHHSSITISLKHYGSYTTVEPFVCPHKVYTIITVN